MCTLTHGMEDSEDVEVAAQQRPILERSLKDQYSLMKPVPTRMWNTGKEANVPHAVDLKVFHGIQRIP